LEDENQELLQYSASYYKIIVAVYSHQDFIEPEAELQPGAALEAFSEESSDAT